MSPFSDLAPPDWPLWQLRAQLCAEQGDRLTFAVRVPQLAGIWGCSPKTARRQLQRLHAAGALTYRAGRGRGHTSQLSFPGLAGPQVRELAAALVAAGQLADWSRLSALPFPPHWTRPAEVREHFGLQSLPYGRDRLRTVLTRPLTSLDPVHAWVTFEAWLLYQVFDPLVRFDPRTGALQPALAHHWKVSEDGLTWRFRLRKAALFHHGRPADSGDARYSLERLLREAPWYLPGVAAVTAPDALTLDLQLQRPDAFLLRRLAHVQALILPADLPFSEERLVGTGAFQFERFDGGLRLRAFDHYFGERPQLDEAEFYFVPPSPVYAAYQLQGERAEALRSHWQVENGVQFLIWNAHRPAAHSRPLRQALAELHDPRAHWAASGQEAQPLATSFYPHRSAAQPPRLRSLERARAWMDGVPDPGPLTLYALDFPAAQAEAHWLARRAALLGLTVQVRTFALEDDGHLQAAADLVLMGEVSDLDTELSFWKALHDPRLLFRRLLPARLLAWSSRVLQSLSEDAMQNARLIGQVEAALQGSGWVNLTHHRVKQGELHPWLQGVQHDAFGRLDLKRMWVDRWPLE
ncbi:ABC transporter substrate-binding protein [Deinococcus sp. Marseille-Q6407]|uniref:ABC transporter substrate-binding protein n=1 Tax=Deinococcus sp. Marseille-Q6407 TaxID=2969223 RepID=UPI0021C02A0A|nr:ABC transporter substrate-binding protein [Deinococcus sp. Marseille-Q6407]